MRHTIKTLTLAGSALAFTALSGCGNMPEKGDLNLAKVCKEYCRQNSPNKPNYTMMLNQVSVEGQPNRTVPARHVYVTSETGALITPYDAAYGNMVQNPEALGYMDKSEGLEPACFSQKKYEPIKLSEVKLNENNTTITLVNFTESGRLESRELSPETKTYDTIKTVFDGSYIPPQTRPASWGQYQHIQDILSSIPPSVKNNPAELQDRNLVENYVPKGKTPFYSDLTKKTFFDDEGHVYFYVLIDDHLKFSRDYLALVTYAPQSGVQELYTPFVQHPVSPKFATMNKNDVLTFQFFRNPDLEADKIEECRYVYDMHVISIGQDDSGNSTQLNFKQEHSTPLFIDPEVKTRGVIINQ